MAERKSVDWEAIEREYRAGQLSVREIARTSGVTETAIRKHAKADGWTRALAEKVREAVREKLVRGRIGGGNAGNRQRRIQKVSPIERQFLDFGLRHGAGYLRSSGVVHLPFRNPPGFLSAEDNARLLRGQTPPRSYTKDRRVINMQTASVEDLIAAGILFCGTPDEVYEQIVDFCQYCGGMGNLLMMGHAGNLSHGEFPDFPAHM